MTVSTAVNATADTPPQAPLIEREQIDGLIAVAGVAGARDILDAYWRSTDSLLEALRAQLQEASSNEAARTAHALKGSSLNVGAVRFSDWIRSIEDCCRQNDVAGARDYLGDAERCYAETSRAFSALLASAE